MKELEKSKVDSQLGLNQLKQKFIERLEKMEEDVKKIKNDKVIS